jgi:hypothetical protein
LQRAVFYFFLNTFMLTFRSALSKETHNTFQKFDGLMTGPCLRNAREMTLGMLLGESSYLSRIGSVVAGEVTPRKNTERYSRMLGKIDTALCTKQHIACASLQFRSEPVLLLWDGGDYQKPHARAMKKICKTVDGSNAGEGLPHVRGNRVRSHIQTAVATCPSPLLHGRFRLQQCVG